MEKKYLISVIVPLYNYEKYIGYCIKSILNQTYKNFELIIVDDCSLDDSYKISKKYEKKDNRVKIIKLNKNSGYSKAKNEGIVISKGKYITTLDADDMMTKNSLDIRIRSMLTNSVDFVYADAFFVKDDISLKNCYKTNSHRVNKSLDLYNIHAQTIMMDRKIYTKYGLYDENLRSRSDREMWWRLFGKDSSTKSDIKTCYIEECVAYYRYHRDSMWRKRKRDKKLDDAIIRKTEKAYTVRKKQGVNKINTRFLE